MDLPWFTKQAGPFTLISYLFGLFRAAREIRKIIRSEGVDIVHANTFIAALYCILPRIKTGVPLLWHMHDILEFTPVNKFFIKTLGKVAYPEVDPGRFYYHMRNSIYIFKKNLPFGARSKATLGLFLQTLYTAGSHSQAASLIWNALRGAFDGFSGRLGKRGGTK